MKNYWIKSDDEVDRPEIQSDGCFHGEYMWTTIRFKGNKRLLSFTANKQYSIEEICGYIPKDFKIISTCCSLVLSDDGVDVVGFRWVVECELLPNGQ